MPTATAQRFAATATPEPELEPQGFRSNAYGLRVWPPLPLQPLVERDPRKFAHSLRLVFPRITAPAFRNISATKESCGGIEPRRAKDPAVVLMRSCVSMLSLIRTGMPWSGPRGPFLLRSASSEAAMAMASGLVSITEFNLGPCRSISSIRARYFLVNVTAEDLPDAMRA